MLQGLTPGSSKEDLVWAVQHHFKYQEVRGFQVAGSTGARDVRSSSHRAGIWRL